MDGWIDLVEYSAKYGISQSTLRRRIRAQALEYRMERGKYLIQDSIEALRDAPLFARQIHYAAPRQSVRAAHLPPGSPSEEERSLRVELDRTVEENRRLKSQIAELETLVGALEADLKNP